MKNKLHHACLCIGDRKLDPSKGLCDKCLAKEWDREMEEQNPSSMENRIKQLQDMLPEWIDIVYPKGSENRGMVTVEILLFLLWANAQLNENKNRNSQSSKEI